MLSRLRDEMADASKLATREIKSELQLLKLPTSDVFDRTELVRRLAVGRLKRKLALEGSLPKRQTVASALIEEMEMVSALSDEEVVRRLQREKIDVGDIGDRMELIRKLALLNLGYGPPTAEGTVGVDVNVETSSEADNDGTLLEEIKEFAGETAEFIKDSIAKPMAGATRDVSGLGSAVSNRLQGARNFTSKVAYTRAEMKAKNFIDGKPFVEEDLEPAKDREGENLLADSLQLDSFDDLYYWALTKSRSGLVKLLKLKQVDVPKFAPLSTVASFVADTILAERKMLALKDNESADYDDEARALLDMPRQRPARERAASPPSTHRKTTSSSFDEFEPERVLISRLQTLAHNFVSKTLPSVWFAVTKPEYLETLFGSVSKAVLTSPISFSVGALIGLLASGGSQFASGLGKWAGGSLLTPPQALFLASLYCIVMRKGALSFAGVLVAIRLVRTLITDERDRDKEREDRETLQQA